VTVEQFTDSRGERAREVRRIRFKLVSKIDALELLGKHHKLYIDRVEHEYGGVGLADRLAAALARVDGENTKRHRGEGRALGGHASTEASAADRPAPAIATCGWDRAASAEHCPKSAKRCPSKVDTNRCRAPGFHRAVSKAIKENQAAPGRAAHP
jgi:hypothetical protein